MSLFAGLFKSAGALKAPIDDGLFSDAFRRPADGAPPPPAAPKSRKRAAAAAADEQPVEERKKKRAEREGAREPAAAPPQRRAAAAAAPAPRGTAGSGQHAPPARPPRSAAALAADAARLAKRKAAYAKAAVEAEKLSRTVFVGNLAPGVSRRAVEKLFAGCGEVESARLRSLTLAADTKLPRRAAVAAGALDAARGTAHAYVVFKDAAGAAAALALNMREVEGRHLRVDAAAAPAAAPAPPRAGAPAPRAAPAAAVPGVRYDPARSVFVGNLHLAAEDEDVIRLFAEGVGAAPDGAPLVEAVRVVRDAKTSAGKGVAYVLLASAAARRAALALDGRPLRGRPLRVTSIARGPTGGAAAWQGVAATAGGKVRKPAVAKAGGGRPTVGRRKNKAKRPAVAARKEQQLSAAPRRGGR
jgi:nucleolar protein 12